MRTANGYSVHTLGLDRGHLTHEGLKAIDWKLYYSDTFDPGVASELSGISEQELEEAGWGEQLYFSKVNENATVEALRNYLVASGYQFIHEQAEDGWMTVAG